MQKAFKYRLYPSREQRIKLEQTLNTCRILYNSTLAERRLRYKEGSPTSYHEQAISLPTMKVANPFVSQVHSQVLQDVLRRLDKSFKNFFRRVKAGEKAGYPRFKGEGWFKSFTYPQSGFSIDERRKLHLSRIGDISIKLHRHVEGAIKTCTIKREADKWYAVFCVQLPEVPKVKIRTAVGVDVGLKSIVTLSTGEKIEPPKFLKKSEQMLARAQRTLSLKKKGSSNRKKAKLKVACLNARIANRRLDFLHKLSRQLVNAHDLIAFEDLRIKNMLSNHHLAKSIADSSWGMLQTMTSYKAEEAGKTVKFVAPSSTSQECSKCGAVVEKSLAVRVHKCRNCGLVIDRDINAALNILKRVGWDAPEFTPAKIPVGIVEAGSPGL